MRESLKKSIDDRAGFERYPKGSIVLCQSCARPIFKLDFGLTLGDKGGQAAKAFKPVSSADLDGLQARQDIDAGVRATINLWTPEQRKAHLDALHEVKTGDPMTCPICHDTFVQVLAVTKHEVLDKAYTIELVTIPPEGVKPWAVRGRPNLWVH